MLGQECKTKNIIEQTNGEAKQHDQFAVDQLAPIAWSEPEPGQSPIYATSGPKHKLNSYICPNKLIIGQAPEMKGTKQKGISTKQNCP